jgi:hypothetical protein
MPLPNGMSYTDVLGPYKNEFGSSARFSIQVDVDGVVKWFKIMITCRRPGFTKDVGQARQLRYGEAWGMAINLMKFGHTPKIVHVEHRKQQFNRFDD